jgi:hypothetical protein
VEPDDRDPWQEVSENERAEYEAWSDWVSEQMKKEEQQNGRESTGRSKETTGTVPG